ncbi:MAG TPA: methyl-accepting chemotaxis protein [Candidatus Binatia bacterium]|nr:methyl-accepting chemotaxis protein [Candidatus Binatia bacterium]
MKKSLSVKLAFGIAGILSLVLGVMAWVSVSYVERQYIEFVDARSEVLARPLRDQLKDLFSQIGNQSSVFVVMGSAMAKFVKENSEVSNIGIYDPSGKLLAHTDKSKKEAVQDQVQKAVKGRPQKPVTIFFDQGYHTLIPVVHEKALVYLAMESRTEVIEKVRSGILWTFLFLSLVSLVVGGVGTLLLLRRFLVKPIYRLVALLKDVAEGEGDLTARLDAGSEDEIGELAKWFNVFVEKIQNTVQTIGRHVQDVASSSEELTSVSHQMSANSEETAAQSNVVSAASEQVSKSVQTVAAGVEEIGASIKEIAKNTTEAARVAKEAVAVAEKTNQTITKLGASSTEIGNVIKVITSIAEQTNLLALNATIEAARAGEAGKGFAVVANEVKELAKQTGEATEDISNKIGAIQHDTQGAVDAIGTIGKVINQISDIANTIASAVEEQSVTTNEMSRNVAEASKGSNEIVQNITGVAQAAQSTASGATQTQTAAQELASLATELQAAVNQFKYDSANSGDAQIGRVTKSKPKHESAPRAATAAKRQQAGQPHVNGGARRKTDEHAEL